MFKVHALQALALSVALHTAFGQQHIPITKEREVHVVPIRGEALTYEMSDLRLPVFSLAAYANMSDSAIVAHMAVGDSLEIAMANLAALRATDPLVREYATMLSNDHTAHLARTLARADSALVTPAPLADDPEAARMKAMLAWLDNTPAGPGWDAAFLRFQVAHHQNEIDVVNANVKNAHDGRITGHMEHTRLSLVKHRDVARSVLTTSPLVH
jgi:predicted outer membrane protein